MLLVGCVHRRECIQKWHDQGCLAGALAVCAFVVLVRGCVPMGELSWKRSLVKNWLLHFLFLACRLRSYGGTEFPGALAKSVFLSLLVCLMALSCLTCWMRSYGGTELEEVCVTSFCFV